MKKVFIFLFDGFADWEIAYLAPEIQKNDDFELIYFSENGRTVTSMGGLKITPNLALSDISTDEVEMLILPGGKIWEENGNQAVAPLAKAVVEAGKTLAAICAATTFIARLGLLDNRKHTSNDPVYLKAKAPDYTGEENYVNKPAVTDQNIISASGIAPIEFAKEVFTALRLMRRGQINQWFMLYKKGIYLG